MYHGSHLADVEKSNRDMTAAVKRGDVYWVTPEDGGGSVAHPHVVVQEDVFNRSRVQTVIVCALTTNLKRATEPGNVLLDIGEGSLNKQSVVVVSQVSSVSKASLGERIGTLTSERVDQVIAGMRFQQASFFGD
jgi:mRNA interferase MazF